jgi:hypothetical protein
MPASRPSISPPTSPAPTIATDDPELLEIVRSLGKSAYSPSEWFKTCSLGLTKGYEELNSGRLTAVYCGRRRMILAIDGAKWLLMLRRQSVASDAARIRGEQARDRQLAPNVQQRRQERRKQRTLAAEPTAPQIA